MARTKKANDIEIVEDAVLAPDLTANQNLISTVQNEYNDDRDLINQLIGQAQMADAFAKFSATVATSKLALVKENKLYRGLKGKKTGNGCEFLAGTWDEFCSLIGISARKADTDIQNLRVFGEDALDSMSKMGIGYRELSQFRRLPEAEKTSLIATAETGDKEALLELAQELLAKEKKDNGQLQQKLSQTADDLEASRKLLGDKEKRFEKLFYEKSALEDQITKRIKTETPDQVGAALREQVSSIAYEAEAIIRGSLNSAFNTLVEHTERKGISHSEFMAGVLAQLELTVNQMRGTFDIKTTPDGEVFDTKWLEDGVSNETSAE